MRMFLNYFCLFYTLTCGLQLAREKALHKPNNLSDDQLHRLASAGNTSHIDVVLDNILIPRVVGTQNHKSVRNYIVKELTQLGWKVDVDEFQDNTPIFGKLTFANIVATHNPKAKRNLVFACHYDSKYTREGDFVGATDSAVPCAMLLNLAVQMKDMLKTAIPEVSLKLIFFDGEEAFRKWGPTDSIYGARHLAESFEGLKSKHNGNVVNELDRMDMLVLLDLLGAPDPKFYSYFKETEKWYIRLAEAEERLAEMGQLRQYSRGQPQQTYFARRSFPSYVEDDHIPFMTRKVAILHIIPHPFPDVWHTSADNRSVVDMHTVENLNKIFRVFIAEYLKLSV